MMLLALLLLHVAESVVETRLVGCSTLNYCHGHGRCVSSTQGSPSVTCECFDGWGSPSDVAIDKMIDCSQRTCRAGKTPFGLRECSSNGLCDRTSGLCQCFNSWESANCERRSCFNQCSGHGQCVPTHNNSVPQCLCDPEYSGGDCSIEIFN